MKTKEELQKIYLDRCIESGMELFCESYYDGYQEALKDYETKNKKKISMASNELTKKEERQLSLEEREKT